MTAFDPRTRYQWSVHTTTGQTIHEASFTGTLKDLDWSQIASLELRPVVSGYPPIKVTADLAAGERAIKFRQVDMSAHTGHLHEIREVVGLQRTVNGRNVKTFVLFEAGGRVLIQSDPNPQDTHGPPATMHTLWCDCDGAGTCPGCRIEDTVRAAHGELAVEFLRAHLTHRSL